MGNMLKNRKILVSVVYVSFITAANFAVAASPSVFISPANLEKEIGQSFDLSTRVDGAGQKVCVVEGKISLNNLSCQSIAVSDGLSVQTSPTCANPAFLLGIQGCNSAVKNLFTITVKAANSGGASAIFSDLDIVGEGVSISNISTGGNYTITAPVAPTIVIPTLVIPTLVTPPQSQLPVAESQPQTTQENPGEQVIPQAEEEQTSNLVVPVVFETGTDSTGLLASVANILSFGTGKAWLLVISVAIILIIFASVVIYFVKKFRKEKIQQ